MRRALSLALVLAGAALLATLLHAVGIARLAAELRALGWAAAAVVALELVVDACNTLAWRQTLAPPVGLARLFWIRQAGTAVNQLTPTATVGGEVVKTWLLRPGVPAAEAVASLLATRTSYALAQALVVLAGLGVLAGRLDDAPGLVRAAGLVLAAMLVGVGLLVVLQRRGVFAPLAARVLGGRGGVRREPLHAGAVALDRALATLHARPRAFAASLAWHCTGQLVSLMQLLVILAALGTPVDLATALALEALALVVDAATFVVPARLGVQEGGRVLAFVALGLEATTGLAVAVTVRLTQLAVTALGLGAWAYLSTTSARTDSIAGT